MYCHTWTCVTSFKLHSIPREIIICVDENDDLSRRMMNGAFPFNHLLFPVCDQCNVSFAVLFNISIRYIRIFTIFFTPDLPASTPLFHSPLLVSLSSRCSVFNGCPFIQSVNSQCISGSCTRDINRCYRHHRRK